MECLLKPTDLYLQKDIKKHWFAGSKFKILLDSRPKVETIIEQFLFAEREPLRDEVLDLIQGNKSKILGRKKVGGRILKRILGFVDTFMSGFMTDKG